MEISITQRISWSDEVTGVAVRSEAQKRAIAVGSYLEAIALWESTTADRLESLIAEGVGVEMLTLG